MDQRPRGKVVLLLEKSKSIVHPAILLPLKEAKAPLPRASPHVSLLLRVHLGSGVNLAGPFHLIIMSHRRAITCHLCGRKYFPASMPFHLKVGCGRSHTSEEDSLDWLPPRSIRIRE